MEKYIVFKDEIITEEEIIKASIEYSRIVLDLGNLEMSPKVLSYLLKIFRIVKSKNKDLVFISKNEMKNGIEKYFRCFKNYEDYKQLSLYTSFEIKLYIDNTYLRNLLNELFFANGFIVKERNENNFLGKNHDSKTKNIYIVNFDSFQKEKLEEIKQIKDKNKDSIIILLVDQEIAQTAIKAVSFGVDSIIQKPFNKNELLEIVKNFAIQSNFKYENKLLNKKIEEELNIAREIQQGYFPEKKIKFGDYNIEYIFKPSQRIGGDICNILKIDENKIAIVFADISGHGIPSALLSSMLMVFITQEYKDFESPTKFIEYLNEKIIDIFPKGKFVSMFYIILDIQKNIMTYCKASQESALLLKNNEIQELETEGQLLGIFSKKIFKDLVKFEEKQIEFTKNSTLLLYTDGIIESSDKNSNMYGLDKLKKEFLKYRNDIYSIEQTLEGFNVEDDLTLLTIWRGDEKNI